MTAYIIRRLIQTMFILFIVSLLVFFAIRLLPGNPVLMYLSREQYDTLTAEQIERTTHQLGLDKPLMVQYGEWVADIAHGELGTSLFYREKVSKILAQRLPVTLHLGLLAFVIANILGIIAGIISALRRGTMADTLVTFAVNIGITLPIFWLGILLIYLFGLKLHWLPIFGYTSPFKDFWLNTKEIIMPVICLSIFTVAATARQTRSSMLEVIQQDYVRTAWSKGLRERTVVFKHVMKNGLIPVVTLMGVHLGSIIGGSVLIETVFNIRGMGILALDALLNLDYIVVQAVALIVATMVILVNLVVDISYCWLDPRIRFE
jgi:peptide/nickel transport system permease protein